MEQTITMMTEEEIPEVGPNDIVIHLVNPYKCGLCDLEFLEKAVFKKHMFSHLEQIKQERPSSQIVMSITLPPETPGGVTVTRDILQLGEDGSIKQVLQPTHNLTLNQVSPLRELEEAGVIKLEQPKPEVMIPKRVTQPIARSSSVVTNAAQTQQGQPEVDLIQDVFTSVVSPPEVQVVVKQPTLKDAAESTSEVSEMAENNDGFLSFALKGPNDEMQHIQIIRSEGAGDLMLELGNDAKGANRVVASNKNNCDICGKVLSSSTNLIRHKMYHSAERPFVCEICNKGFKDICNLKKHAMIHKRIFPCYLCKKSFLRKSLLALHLRRHEARTTLVKSGNSMKEVTIRTFVDEDGTRVEEMCMAALGGQTFEYKQRIVKADPGEIDRQVKKEIEAEKRAQADAGTTTEPEITETVVSEENTEENTDQKPSSQKTIFMVTMNGLQETVVEQPSAPESSQENVFRKSESSSIDEVAVDDMPDLKIPDVPEEFVKVYQCGHCGKRTVQRGNMMRHLIHHLTDKPFRCDECPKQFVDKGELVKHKKTHSKPYRCQLCHGAFAHNAQLLKHLQSACLGNTDALNYTIMEDGKTYKCDICRIEMKRLGNMIKHVRTHSISHRKPMWNEARKVNLLKSGKRPEAPYYYDSNRRLFVCGYCSKSFALKASVYQHVKVHTKEKPYQCADCDRWFSCAAALKRHLQIHTKPFKCEKCPLAFSRKLFLDAHQRKHYQSEKDEETTDYGLTEDKLSYYCKHCSKKLPNKYRMMSHVRSHVNKRPFECPTCNKCFSSQYMLLKHKKIHVKPFVCSQCGETFTRKIFMDVHKVKMHTYKEKEVELDVNDSFSEVQNFPCSICGAPFDRLVIKMNHEKKCAEECKVMMRLPEGKGYKCKICNKVASLKHNLMVHIRKHDNIVSVDKSGSITFLDESFVQENDNVKQPVQNVSDKEEKEKTITIFQPTSVRKKKVEVCKDDIFDDEANVEDVKDSRYKKTAGGYACLSCRRKFIDFDLLMKHLDSHGDIEDSAKKTNAKNKQEQGKSQDHEVKMEAEDIRQDNTDSMDDTEKPVSSSKTQSKSTPKSASKRKISEDTKMNNSTKSKVSTPKVSHKPHNVPADNLTPSRSGSRPARVQKIPSRFLE